MIRVTAAVLLLVGTATVGLLRPEDSPGPFQDKGQPAAGAVLTNSYGMKLAYIPAGKFRMGSPSGEAERSEEELPHEVTISKPFYMGVYEVTQREFQQLLHPPRFKAIFTERRGGGPDHPMENVRWDEANQFCQALSNLPGEQKAGHHYRLPTEAEWEYACRAGTTTPFAFGQSLSSKQANFNGNYPYGGAEKGPYLRKTTKVGSFAPNAWGLYDMHGNVAEWCSDFYDPEYYKKTVKVDPRGPLAGMLSTDYNGYYRVIRGGCWLDDARACRSAYRFRAMPHDEYRLIGFRVVCNVSNPNP